MKLKYYLRGLGIGIIVSTLILMIVYHVKGTMSDEAIMNKAEELGMVYPSSEPDTLFPSETTTPEETVPEENTTEETTSAEPETTTEEPTTPEPETTTAVPETEPPTEPSVSNYTLTISGGMYSEAVSRVLAENGIVGSSAEFNKYLISNGYSDYIQTGTFEVNSGMGYDEIARIITRS